MTFNSRNKETKKLKKIKIENKGDPAYKERKPQQQLLKKPLKVIEI